MTDENEKLSVAELKQRLIKLKPSEALRIELRERDLPQGRVEDAMRLINGTYSEGTWTTPGDPRPRSVSELADEFETEREYMFRDVHERAPQQAAIDPRTHYANGEPLPPDQIDDFALAGPTPEVKPEQPTEPQPGESLIDADLRAAGPMPKQGLSDAGLEEWNDELDAHAKYREEAQKERVAALKEAGMRIDEPVRELKK